jgi:hypothetical protein
MKKESWLVKKAGSGSMIHCFNMIIVELQPDLENAKQYSVIPTSLQLPVYGLQFVDVDVI